METFYRKNDLGINIEYTIVGKFKENGNNYYIYTDFVSSNDNLGIRLFVDIEKNNILIRLSDQDEKRILKMLDEEIFCQFKLCKEG